MIKLQAKSIFLLLAVTVCSVTACTKQEDGKEQNTNSREEADVLCRIEQEEALEVESRNIYFVSKKDGELLNETDQAAIGQIKGVEKTELHGGAARVKYFYREGEDYEYGNQEGGRFYTTYMPEGRESTRYMMSAENLTSEDLSCGTLPEALDEIVLYTSDESMLGKTLAVYFVNFDDMYESDKEGYNTREYMTTQGLESFIEKDMKITGILKEKTEQMYFSESYCEMMGKVMTGFMYPNTTMGFFYTGENNGIQKLDGTLGPDGDIKISSLEYMTLPWDGDYLDIGESDSGIYYPLVYLDETLKSQEAGISQDWIQLKNLIAGDSLEEDESIGLYNILELAFCMRSDTETDELTEQWEEDASGLMGYTYYADCIGDSGMKFRMCKIIQGISDNLTKSGAYTLAVNQEIFQRIYNYEGSRTIAVYIEPGQEEQVKQELEEQGYMEYELPEFLW